MKYNTIDLKLLINYYLETYGGHIKDYDILRDIAEKEIIMFKVDNEIHYYIKTGIEIAT